MPPPLTVDVRLSMAKSKADKESKNRQVLNSGMSSDPTYRPEVKESMKNVCGSLLSDVNA